MRVENFFLEREESNKNLDLDRIEPSLSGISFKEYICTVAAHLTGLIGLHFSYRSEDSKYIL